MLSYLLCTNLILSLFLDSIVLLLKFFLDLKKELIYTVWKSCNLITQLLKCLQKLAFLVTIHLSITCKNKIHTFLSCSL